MPLVSGNKITVEIDGKVDDLLRDIDRVDKALDEFIAQNRRAEQQSGLTAKNAASSWTDFRSAYSTVLDVVRVGQQVWAATGQEYVNYVQQVEKVSRVTGMQMEDASRLIQVADDLRVSQESLTRSLVFAAKTQNLTVDSIANLADQYNSLGTAQEKAEFAAKNFGRNYAEIAKLLEAGGATIRQMAADVQDFQIADELDKQRVKEYTRALDEMNEAWDKVALTIGEKVVPWVTRFMVAATHQKEIIAEQNRLMAEGANWNDANKQAILNVIDALYGQADATDVVVDGLDELDEAQQAADESAKRLSQALTGILSNMFAINSQNTKYQETLASLARSDEELTAKKNQLTLQMWEEQRAGKLTNDEYLRYIQQIDDVNKSIEENATKRKEASDELAKAGEKQIYDLVQQRLAADGIISSGEFEYLQDLAVQKGLVTRADAEQAIQASRTADALVAAFQQTQPAMDQALETMLQIKSMDGTIVNFGVNFTQSGSLAGMGGTVNPSGYTPINYSSSFSSGQGSPMYVPAGSRDNGGQGMAGTPYLIGTGAQPELFVPQTNGTFTPANKIGNTYNIVINNPKREAAEYSIRAALKNLSFLGVTEQR